MDNEIPLALGGMLVGSSVPSSIGSSLGRSLADEMGDLSLNDKNRLKSILRKEFNPGEVRVVMSGEPNFQGDYDSIPSHLRDTHKIKPGQKVVNLTEGRTSLPVALHELGHAQEPKSSLSRLLRNSNVRGYGGLLSSLGFIPASYVGRRFAEGSDISPWAIAGTVLGALGSTPVLAEELRATRNANRLAKKHNIGKLRGLRRAFGTYLAGAAVPVMAGLGAGTALGIGGK